MINKKVVFSYHAGCLLPLLILFNLFFGWIFLKPLIWLAVEGGLILLAMLKISLLARSMASAARRGGNVLDVEGEVVEDESP